MTETLEGPMGSKSTIFIKNCNTLGQRLTSMFVELSTTNAISLRQEVTAGDALLEFAGAFVVEVAFVVGKEEDVTVAVEVVVKVVVKVVVELTRPVAVVTIVPHVTPVYPLGQRQTRPLI